MNSNTLLTADKFVINNERIKSSYKSNGKSYNPYNVWPLVGGMGMTKRHFTSFRVTYLVNRWLLLRAFQRCREMGDDADSADGGPIEMVRLSLIRGRLDRFVFCWQYFFLSTGYSVVFQSQRKNFKTRFKGMHRKDPDPGKGRAKSKVRIVFVVISGGGWMDS